ncbi:MAG: hypothetical protein WAO00_08920 [Chthoniobacterales bacterium]
MKLARNRWIKAEGGIAIWVIVAALVGGALWFLYSSRQDGEKNARAFAVEATNRVAVQYDEKYLHVHLSPAAQTKYLQSWRERLMQNLRTLGPVKQPIEVKGDVHFTSGFFDPMGNFRAELSYPTTTAVMELVVTRGMTVWQIDDINLIWTPVPTPTPAPTPVMTPTATPAPAPEQQQQRRRRR